MFHSSVIVYSKAHYIERINPCICPCPICPFMICLSPCEQENQYTILHCNPDWSDWGQIYHQIREVRLKDIQRCLCPPSKRSLTLIDDQNYSQIHLRVQRPFKCSFFCLQRPEMLIDYRDQYIGKITEHCQSSYLRCNFYTLTCYDKNESMCFVIESDCCQCGLFCMLPCQQCSEIVFTIKNRKLETVGKICHLFGGFRREWCSKADTYGIQFPELATVEEKIILIIATIFIDYTQFQNY